VQERIKSVKKYILFDHAGVLVNTEFWYCKAGERAPGRTLIARVRSGFAAADGGGP
jgi:hypothetical protein